jgi:hypothetical protein
MALSSLPALLIGRRPSFSIPNKTVSEQQSLHFDLTNITQKKTRDAYNQNNVL